MTINDIIKLVDAGFTKAEIDAMAAPEAAQAPAEITQPEQEAPAEQPEITAPDPVPTNTDQQAGTDQILEALNRLTNSIMSANINQTVAESIQGQTSADLLAKIIAPDKPAGRNK